MRKFIAIVFISILILLGVAAPVRYAPDKPMKSFAVLVAEAKKKNKVSKKTHKKNLKYLLKKGISESFILSVYKGRIGTKKKKEILKRWQTQQETEKNQQDYQKRRRNLNGLSGVFLNRDYVDECFLCGNPIGSKFYLIFSDGNKQIFYPDDVEISADFYLYTTVNNDGITKKDLILHRYYSNEEITPEMRTASIAFSQYLYADLNINRQIDNLGLAEVIVHTPTKGDFSANAKYSTLYENR